MCTYTVKLRYLVLVVGLVSCTASGFIIGMDTNHLSFSCFSNACTAVRIDSKLIINTMQWLFPGTPIGALLCNQCRSNSLKATVCFKQTRFYNALLDHVWRFLFFLYLFVATTHTGKMKSLPSQPPACCLPPPSSNKKKICHLYRCMSLLSCCYESFNGQNSTYFQKSKTWKPVMVLDLMHIKGDRCSCVTNEKRELEGCLVGEWSRHLVHNYNAVLKLFLFIYLFLQKLSWDRTLNLDFFHSTHLVNRCIKCM